MELKLELVRNQIADIVRGQIRDFDIDLNRIANTKAIAMLGEIQAILQNEQMEYGDMIEAISNIFCDNGAFGGWWKY